MSYRDESETLRARIEVLEGELRTANATIARLRGDIPVGARPIDTASVQTSERSWLLGSPLQLALRKVVDAEADDAALDSIAALIHDRLGREGILTRLGRGIAYRQGWAIDMTLTPTDGGTHLQLLSNHGWLRGLVLILALMQLVAYVVVDDSIPPFAIPVSFILGVIVTRVFAGWFLRRRQQELRATLELVEEQIRAHPRVRVAAEPEPSVAEIDDEDAPAVAKQRRRA